MPDRREWAAFGMGALATLWDRWAVAALDPFARFETGLQIPLDAVVVGPESRILGERFTDPRALWADPFADDAAWSFAAQRVLDAPLARRGARIASADVHATELGAEGIVAFRGTPASLAAWAAEGYAGVAASPRRVRIQVNAALPTGVDAIDAWFHAWTDAAPDGFHGAVLEFAGDGYRGLDASGRRRLLATAGVSECLTALGEPDDATADAQAGYDELVILNLDQVRRRVLVRDRVVDAASVDGRPVRRVVAGGCVAGDVDSLARLVEAFEREPADPSVEVAWVPASARTATSAQEHGLAERAGAASVRIARAGDVVAGHGAVAATQACLDPDAFVAGLPTLIDTARAGHLVGGDA